MHYTNEAKEAAGAIDPKEICRKGEAAVGDFRGGADGSSNVAPQVWATRGATAVGVYAKGGMHYTNEAKEAAGAIDPKEICRKGEEAVGAFRGGADGSSSKES